LNLNLGAHGAHFRIECWRPRQRKARLPQMVKRHHLFYYVYMYQAKH
jgi:hypothetical protein